MRGKLYVLITWGLLILTSTAWCQEQLLMHLSFDDNRDTTFEYGQRQRRLTTEDIISRAKFRMVGLATYTPGVYGTALKFDGFSSYVEGNPSFIAWMKIRAKQNTEISLTAYED